MAYTAAVIDASAESELLEDFAEKGNWGTVISATIGGGIGGVGAYVSTKASSALSQTNQPISRGSTGRTQPANLREQLAMEQVKSNPAAGNSLNITMNDPH